MLLFELVVLFLGYAPVLLFGFWLIKFNLPNKQMFIELPKSNNVLYVDAKRKVYAASSKC